MDEPPDVGLDVGRDGQIYISPIDYRDSPAIDSPTWADRVREATRRQGYIDQQPSVIQHPEDIRVRGKSLLEVVKLLEDLAEKYNGLLLDMVRMQTNLTESMIQIRMLQVENQELKDKFEGRRSEEISVTEDHTFDERPD